MHGAALLYNLALSELRQRDDWIEDYRARLEAWSDELDTKELASWSLDDFYNLSRLTLVKDEKTGEYRVMKPDE